MRWLSSPRVEHRSALLPSLAFMWPQNGALAWRGRVSEGSAGAGHRSDPGVGHGLGAPLVGQSELPAVALRALKRSGEEGSSAGARRCPLSLCFGICCSGCGLAPPEGRTPGAM